MRVSLSHWLGPPWVCAAPGACLDPAALPKLVLTQWQGSAVPYPLCLLPPTPPKSGQTQPLQSLPLSANTPCLNTTMLKFIPSVTALIILIKINLASLSRVISFPQNMIDADVVYVPSAHGMGLFCGLQLFF